MADRSLVAALPKPLKVGDEIILKGNICESANEVSFNFALEDDPIPAFIAYHFKTLFIDNTVIHNYKNGSWMDEIVEDNHWIDGPGNEFTLTFHFDDFEILTYTGDENREIQYRFEQKFPMESIKTVQVWGDVQSINEIIFRYSTT